MSRRWITICMALYLLLFSVVCSAAEVISSGEAKPISQERLVAIADEYYQRHYAQIDLKTRAKVDGELFALKSSDHFAAKAARGLSSAAAVMGAAGKSRDVSVVFAAAAVKELPDDALVLNNFGAVLRFLHSRETSVTVLQYARALDPQSTLILTNLANSLLELGDDAEAEKIYQEALTVDPDFAEAHKGLAKLYLKRKEPLKAMDELLKAARFSYSPAIMSDIKQAMEQGATIDQPYDESGSEPEKGDSQPDPRKDRMPDKLIIPPLPDWPDRQAFLASVPSMQKLSSQVMEEGFVGAIKFAAKYHPESLGGMTGSNGGDEFDWGDDASDWGDDASDWGDDASDWGGDDSDWGDDASDWSGDDTDWGDDASDWSDDDSDWSNDDSDWSDDDSDWSNDAGAMTYKPQLVAPDPDAPLFAKKLFGLQLLNMYYADRLEEVLEPFAARKKVISEQYKSGLESLNAGCVDQVNKALASGNFDAAQTLAPACNKQSGQLADIHFSQWKPLTRDTYEKVRVLLEEYWLYSEPLLDDVYDTKVLDYMNQVRRVTVFSSLVPLVLDATMDLPLTYALADYIVPISSSGGSELPAPEPVDDVNAPDKDKGKCKFEKGKVKVGCGPVSVAISCKGVELEYTNGIAVGASFNFDGGGTIFVGVGGKSSAGPVTLGGKAGVTVSFDNGGVVDIGVKGEVETGGGVFDAGGSGTVSADVGLIAPANLDADVGIGVDHD